MKRRKFLGILTLGTLIIGAISWFFVIKKQRLDTGTFDPDILSNICSREKIIEIGIKYRQISSENDKETLARLLEVEGQKSVKQYFENKVRQDFENNDTVLIDGWLLSVTEARQCALLSLQTN